jgi:hypothetical protein
LRNGRFMSRQGRERKGGRSRPERGERRREGKEERETRRWVRLNDQSSIGHARQGKKKSVGWLWRVGALLGAALSAEEWALLVRGI